MNLGKKRNVVRALLQHLCEGCFQQCGCHILVDAGVGDDRGEGPDDCAAPPPSIRKTKSSFLVWPAVSDSSVLPGGRGRKRNAVGNVPPTRTSADSGEHRSTRKTIKCKSPPIRRDVYWLRPTAEGPWQINWLWLFRERDGGNDGGGRRWRWRGDIEGLASVLRPYHSLQSAGSAAVSKLKLTGSAAAPHTPPPPTSLTVIWQPSLA